MKRKVAYVCGVVLLAACDGARQASTVAPTPIPSVRPAGGLTGAYALSGIVRAAGVPVAVPAPVAGAPVREAPAGRQRAPGLQS